MPRTQSVWAQDSPFSNALGVLGLSDIIFDNNTFQVIRAALGNWKLRRISGGAEVYNMRFNLSYILPQKIQQTSGVPFLDQNLPQAAGIVGPSNPYYPGSPEVSGTPILGSLSFAKKGVRVKDITVIYGITGVALTSATPSLNTTLFANNVAPAVTNMPLTGALATAVQAQPYSTKLTVTSPAFIVTDLTELTFEVNWVLQNATVLDIYKIMVHFDYNLN